MIKEWCSAKIKCNVMFIIIWCILRILLVVSFYATISMDIDYLIQILYPLLTRGTTQSTEQMSTSTPTQTNVTSKFNATTYDDVTTPEINVTFPFNVLRARTCESQYIHGWYYDLQEVFDLSDGYWAQLRIILGFVIYLFLYMTCSLIFDTISMLNITIINRHKSWSNFLGKSKDRVVASLFYKMCQSSFTVWSLMYLSYSFVTSLLFADISQEPHTTIKTIVKIGLIFTCFFSVWSILYFVQLLPFVGPFVNSIQKMLGIMVSFIIVYFIMIFPYPHAFLALLKGNNKCRLEGFETVWNGMYTSFNIMLNKVDLDTYPLDGKFDYQIFKIM